MFRNYLIIAIRNLYRNKLFSVINILGLAIGMAATLLITEFIVNELSYDKFHSNKDDIYRIIIRQDKDGNSWHSDIITAGVSESVVAEFPEARSMCRFSSPQPAYFANDNKDYYEDEITYADSSLFEIFSFKLLSGDEATCLTKPNSVVLTDEVSEKIFGDANPVGKVLIYNGETQLKITGVVEKPPANSSISFDAIISFSTLYQMDNVYLGWDGGWNYEAFILLEKENVPADMKDRFEDFMEKHINYKYREHGFVLSLILQPLSEVHLYSGRDYELEGQGRLVNLYVFSSIALFILMIACFNFMNLSTARSIRRAKEVGIRKVVGANRRTIIYQFLGESVLVSLIALIISLILIEVFQPVFNDLIRRDLHLYDQSGIIVILIFISMVIFTGILAGSYPAFFMARFQVVRVIKGNFVQRTGKPVFRNILVVIQFTISAFLISSTLIIQSQINFLQDKDLGFSPEDVYVIPLTTKNARDGYQSLKTRINGIPDVISLGTSTGIPGQGVTSNGYTPQGLKDPIMIHVIDIDDDYLDVMNIPVIMGEGFSREAGMDSLNILINESLVKRLAWDDPIGKTIHRDTNMKVIGVVEDFHFAPLNEDIEPLLMTQVPWNGFYHLTVRTSEGRGHETMMRIKDEWDILFPDESFEYFSLEEYISEAYTDVSGLRSIFIYFAILAIIVACLGLLGLTSYSTGQKTREVGIRKVFGADNSEITFKLVREFLKWVLMANIIAFPFAGWAMDNWLQNFAYRINTNFIVMLYTLLITFGLSILTIIFQTMRLARTNPADILKDE